MFEWRYAERILYIDLTTGLSWMEPTSLELKRDYIGGAGFVARLLADVGGPAMVLACGPLSDEMAGRLAIGVAPGMALSNVGGRLAGAIKAAGYDAVVITGQSLTPVSLVIDEEGAELVGAEELWGRDIFRTEATLRLQHGGAYASLVIGPAGEEGLANATVAHEGHYCGGGGVGAHFGAAGLKAILVRDKVGRPGTCTGCTLACPARSAPEAERANLLGIDLHPADKKRRRPGVADLLGTCQRTVHDRPGAVLRDALSATIDLIAI